MVYWFTGQPGSGKTSLAGELKKRLESIGRVVLHVDGDEIRDLKNNKNFNKSGRTRNIEDATIIALVANKQGMDVVVSLVSPIREMREAIKSQLKSEFIEIYCQTAAPRKPAEFFVSDYEAPKTNYIHLNTDLPLEVSLANLIYLLGTFSEGNCLDMVSIWI